MIGVEGRAHYRLLESVKRRRIVNLGRSPMPREISARPVIDEIVAERTAGPIGEMVVSVRRPAGRILG